MISNTQRVRSREERGNADLKQKAGKRQRQNYATGSNKYLALTPMKY